MPTFNIYFANPLNQFFCFLLFLCSAWDLSTPQWCASSGTSWWPQKSCWSVKLIWFFSTQRKFQMQTVWSDFLLSNWCDQWQEAATKVNSIEGMIEEYERRLGGMTVGFLEGLFKRLIFSEEEKIKFKSACMICNAYIPWKLSSKV